eukprot:CAMPEP_0173415076 /NCGR_PEP_ID=MMETSP1356-20130122/84668_1 /TAXON_ID=77927 ORGANISM="Hemiselmis virescens, Strain PCC157" /NCGR_SAMPLE_ID=MMETSP1356 /ASSEMBLY_ACC=CAM_ASM_000847 /LENGTH=314 /DNA_ID=CAMNT_0014377301 /DNA_START=8 /DNA_END=952 /DNA_ORIENTATION=+
MTSLLRKAAPIAAPAALLRSAPRWLTAGRQMHMAATADTVAQMPPPGLFVEHQSSSLPLQGATTRVPKLGLSTYLTPPGMATKGAVSHALKEGYRHIDTSELFKNERDVGAAIQGSGLDRDQIFITTRYWHHLGGKDTPQAACRASTKRLGVGQTDAYLLYAPKGETVLLKTWEGMQDAQSSGLAKHVGLSMASLGDLEAIVRHGMPLPSLVQAPVSPFAPQRDLVQFCGDQNIHLSSLSPLGGALSLDNAVVTRIAKRIGQTPSQVLIRWGIQRGFSCLPKSSSASHITENYGALGFELSEEDMASLNNLRPK